jgi:hypothetical protein
MIGRKELLSCGKILDLQSLSNIRLFCSPTCSASHPSVANRVVGGASKLLSCFKRYNTGSIVSCANLRWSSGNLVYLMEY